MSCRSRAGCPSIPSPASCAGGSRLPIAARRRRGSPGSKARAPGPMPRVGVHRPSICVTGLIIVTGAANALSFKHSSARCTPLGFLSMPLAFQPGTRHSRRPLMCGNSASDWKTMQVGRLVRGHVIDALRHCRRMSPRGRLVHAHQHDGSESSCPSPDGPTIVKNSPSAMSRLRRARRRRFRLPKQLVDRFLSSRIGGAASIRALRLPVWKACRRGHRGPPGTDRCTFRRRASASPRCTCHASRRSRG